MEKYVIGVVTSPERNYFCSAGDEALEQRVGIFLTGETTIPTHSNR